MTKKQDTYAKRKREMDKKLKADEKRARRKKRKEQKTEEDMNSPEIPTIDID